MNHSSSNCPMYVRRTNIRPVKNGLYAQALLLHSELFEVCLVSTEGSLKVKSYNSLAREDKSAYKGLGCLSGEMMMMS